MQGYDAGGKTFRVHLDGYDQRDLLGRKGPSQRREFFYWTRRRQLCRSPLRTVEGRVHGTAGAWITVSVWAQSMVQLRMPMLFNVRSDPFERSQHEAGD